MIVILARYREVGTVRPRDENLEQSQRLLLEKLAKIETGPEIHYTNAMRDFRSELITHFDQWEGAVEPYISDTDEDRIRKMRAHIQSQSLNHAREEGAEWTQTVKEITYTARLNVRPKH